MAFLFPFFKGWNRRHNTGVIQAQVVLLAWKWENTWKVTFIWKFVLLICSPLFCSTQCWVELSTVAIQTCVHLSLQMQLVKTKHMVLYEAYCYCSLPALEVLIFFASWVVKYCPILAKGEHGFETIIFGRSLFKIIIIFSRHPTFYHKNINVRTVTDVRCIANTITDINILSRLDLGEGAVFYQGHFK